MVKHRKTSVNNLYHPQKLCRSLSLCFK